ncbi:MAG: restriction endonuclease [Spirochaetaceae bacterium]|nr:restriction endonuclease [Spirochaetaceae bacterium]
MIPDYQTCMLPLLKYAEDKNEHKFSDAVEYLSDEFALTKEERKELLPSKTQDVITNRIGWARTYLKKAGLLEDTRRGYFKITERGLSVLSENLEKLSTKYLQKFDEFIAFREKHTEKDISSEIELTTEATPEEMLETGFAKLSENLIDDLLAKIRESSPSFFEHLVVDLLVHMGYGGSFSEAAQVVGKSGDEGIDGIIKEDKLGLDTIYIQAKRWKGVVGRPEIQKFAGALLGQKASKGVFITTSSFTKEAEEYVSSVDRKVVLIDGTKLATLMIEHNVGISTVRTFEIKRIDSDYFEG